MSYSIHVCCHSTVWRMQRGAMPPPLRSVNGTLLPQPANKFAWADGHWGICSTYRTVWLLNVATIRDFRSQNGRKWSKKALAAGTAPRNPLGNLQRSPDPLAGLRGRKRKRRGGDEEKREGIRRRMVGKREGRGNRGEGRETDGIERGEEMGRGRV